MTSLFGHAIRSELLLLIAAEAVLCFFAFAAILAVAAPDAGLALHLAAALALTLGAGLVSGASGLYHPAVWFRPTRLCAAAALAGLVLAVAVPGLLLPEVPAGLPSGALALLLAFLAALMLARLGFALALRRGLLQRRVVVIGGCPELLRADPFLEVVLAVPAAAGDTLSGERLTALRPWAVVAERPDALPPALLAGLASGGARVVAEAEFCERRLGRVDLAALTPGWLAASRTVRTSRLEAALRRLLDLSGALFLLLLTLPVTLLAALAIRLDTPGPVLYRQQRIGLGGRPFTIFKFRSMIADAEKAGAPVWASQRDPRITRVGHLLRRTRIDELPQLLNVLRGEMSLVGPRPERPGFVARLAREIAHYDDRHVVKPGITGWAQVNFPYGASVEDARQKLAYDLYYVRRRSLFLDILILVATVRVVLFQEGSR